MSLICVALLVRHLVAVSLQCTNTDFPCLWAGDWMPKYIDTKFGPWPGSPARYALLGVPCHAYNIHSNLLIMWSTSFDCLAQMLDQLASSGVLQKRPFGWGTSHWAWSSPNRQCHRFHESFVAKGWASEPHHACSYLSASGSHIAFSSLSCCQGFDLKPE